jgi:CheY-like chemotaxis protein
MSSPITIFYTDDDREDLSNFQEAVNDLKGNIILHTMNHGEELLSALKNPPPTPNVIFLDINMPGKSGFELLKEIKSSDNYSQLPVIIFSTSDDPKAISTAQELGADLFITKPNNFPALRNAISYSINIDWKLPRPENFFYNAN